VAQLLVRDLDDAVLIRLKERAHRNGRSLDAELRAVLEDAASQYTRSEALAVFRSWQLRFADRSFSDSAELIREDRGR
jgi:antitoxin FitA